MNETNFYIKGLKVLGESQVYEDGYVKVDKGQIEDIGLLKDLKVSSEELTYHFPSTFTLIPGMIDIHIHGANGADMMDATFEALDTMTGVLPQEGTTSFLATTLTQGKAAIEMALTNAARYIKEGQKSGHAELLGIHLEGPFISKEKAGAQPLEHMVKPSCEQFDHFQVLAGAAIKLVTLAPEEDESLALTKHLRELGVIASIGHSNATYQQVDEAIAAGASHVTHLYNGMSGLHHREPGVVGAALLRDELMAELIVDGVHIRPEVIDLTIQQKGKDHLVLITDAMRAKCLENGIYELGGQPVYVKDGKAALENGSLAGSVLKMKDALKNLLDFTPVSLEDAVQMASANPAIELQIFDRKGSLAVGKDADLVILNEALEVEMTFCRGVLAYKKRT